MNETMAMVTVSCLVITETRENVVYWCYQTMTMVTVSRVVITKTEENLVYLCYQTMTIVTVSSVVITDTVENVVYLCYQTMTMVTVSCLVITDTVEDEVHLGPRLTKGTLQHSAKYRVIHILKSIKITIFYCHSKRVHSCVMHSSISYLLNLQ